MAAKQVLATEREAQRLAGIRSPNAWSVHSRTRNVVGYTGAGILFSLLVLRFHYPHPPWRPLLMWTAHYVRRTFESEYVHRHRPQLVVPFYEFIGMLVYYYGFAVWIALTLPSEASSDVVAGYVGSALFAIGELINLVHHRLLSDAKQATSDDVHSRVRGLLFEYVVAPHYLGEIIAWCGFSLAIGFTWASLAFAFFSTLLLVFMAEDKLQAQRKMFDGKQGRPLLPPSVRAIVPFFL